MPIRLKSLELQGYKTFANRTLFEFASAITAVVGPNGSGKSNIADSLRWVLGEQSFHLLRGKKTEDMIFSGSELRPRAGMAAATITFDNLDGWLPIDFSEVAITRRAYRDGTNEYLINGQRVRLKDVSELLAQSGLAERTYTIVGQGLVDAALALRAEDRRKLFEEAAGIGLYRGRRDEALRRLDTTKRNLERVADILVELEPRLRSLEKQARRANEYDQIKADLQVLLRDWYGYHWHLAQRELAEARQSANGQGRAVEMARREQIELEEQLTALKENALAARLRLNEQRRQLVDLRSRSEAFERDLAVMDERLRSLAIQRQSALDEIARLDDEIELQGELVDSSRQEIARLQLDFDEAHQQMESARQALVERQDSRKSVETTIQEARQKIISLTSRQGQLEVRILERQDQIEREQEALDAAGRLLAQNERTQQAASQRLQAAQEAYETANSAARTAEGIYQDHQSKLAEAEALRKSIYDEKAALAAELARMQAQGRVLEQAEAALTGYGEGSRRLLQAIRQERLTGKTGAFSQYLDIPSGLEMAVAAALGDFVEAVVAKSGPGEALDILLADDGGRAAVLPLERIKPALPISPARAGLKDMDDESLGWIGVAAEVLSTTSDLRSAVDLLLGATWLVRDRQSAENLLSRLTWTELQPAELARLRLVTLAGEVFYPSGPVQAGKPPAGDGGAGLITRQRQLRELAGTIESTLSREAEIETRYAAVESQLAQLRDQASKLSSERSTALQQAEAASLVAQRARLEAEQSARQLAWQKTQQLQLTDTIEQASQDLKRYQSDLKELDGVLAHRRDELRGLNNELASLVLDEFQMQVAHWTTLAAVASRGLEDETRRLNERLAAIEKSKASQAALSERLKSLQKSEEELGAAKVKGQANVTAIRSQLETLEAELEPGDKALQDLELRQSGLDEALAIARQAVSLADHHFAQTRIVVERRQEAVDSLHRRIEEDFGLVNFEYAEQVSGQAPLPLEGMVEQLPQLARLAPEIEEGINQKRSQLRRIGPVNPEAQSEYQEVRQRFNFLTEQVADLQKAELDIREVIHELDDLMEREFNKTFVAVSLEFKAIFQRLFNGGTARLILTDPDESAISGIEIEARLPGRRMQGLSLLSGGERSLTAVSLIFALLRISPTPFCVLDEVDAMLDEANVGRFRELLSELSQDTQFVVVTHNRNTVQAAETIYGVTMGRDSTSQVISLKMDQVGEIV